MCLKQYTKLLIRLMIEERQQNKFLFSVTKQKKCIDELGTSVRKYLPERQSAVPGFSCRFISIFVSRLSSHFSRLLHSNPVHPISTISIIISLSIPISL